MATYFQPIPPWLWVKIGFVVALYAYHFTLQRIYAAQIKGIFRYSSNQLRIWNELATVFLIAIVLLVSVKNSLSWIWGIICLLLFSGILMGAIKIYKLIRTKP
jgi:putative membrane protein